MSYVFVRVVLCRDDVYYAGRYNGSDHVFMELYKNGNSEDRTRIIFENLEQVKKYLEKWNARWCLVQSVDDPRGHATLSACNALRAHRSGDPG